MTIFEFFHLIFFVGIILVVATYIDNRDKNE